MRVFRLDYLQDAEHRGHHLDREIGKLNMDLGKFHHMSLRVIIALQRIQFNAPAGFDIAAAVSVNVVTRDDVYHFEGHSEEIKAGMLMMSDNHICIWLRDDEARPRHQLAIIFHKELFEKCGMESDDSVRSFIAERIRTNVRSRLIKKHDEFARVLRELEKIQDEQVLFQEQLNSL
jgi:hypothetical protein